MEESLLALLRRKTTLVASSVDAVQPKVFTAGTTFVSSVSDAMALQLLGRRLLLVVFLRMDGLSRVVHCSNEAALPMDVVFYRSGGSVGFFETVLAFGLVTVSGLKVFLNVMGVVVVDSVTVLVLWILQSKKKLI